MEHLNWKEGWPHPGEEENGKGGLGGNGGQGFVVVVELDEQV